MEGIGIVGFGDLWGDKMVEHEDEGKCCVQEQEDKVPILFYRGWHVSKATKFLESLRRSNDFAVALPSHQKRFPFPLSSELHFLEFVTLSGLDCY